MKILYDSNAESVEGVKGSSQLVAESDIVVGRDGRIIKARFGHRRAIETLKKIGRDVAK